MSLKERLGERLRNRAARRVGDAFCAHIEGRHLDTIAPLLDASLCAFACAALGVEPPVANDDDPT